MAAGQPQARDAIRLGPPRFSVPSYWIEDFRTSRPFCLEQVRFHCRFDGRGHWWQGKLLLGWVAKESDVHVATVGHLEYVGRIGVFGACVWLGGLLGSADRQHAGYRGANDG